MDYKGLWLHPQAGEGPSFPWRPTYQCPSSNLPGFWLFMQPRSTILPGTYPIPCPTGRGSTAPPWSRGFPWGWTHRCWEVQTFGLQRKKSRERYPLTLNWKPRRGERTTHRQKPMLPTSGLHLWRRWPWTWSWDLSLLQKQLHTATAWFQSYALGQWRPLTKGTRSGLSMMAHGEEPMPTYRHIVRSALQPPRWWTVCMVSTGSKLPRLNPQGENSPMLIGSGLRNKRSGCCLRQMSPRLIGESRYSLQSGNTRLLVWEMNGGSTRWAPMAWRAPKSTGAAWQPCYFGWYIPGGTFNRCHFTPFGGSGLPS